MKRYKILLMLLLLVMLITSIAGCNKSTDTTNSTTKQSKSENINEPEKLDDNNITFYYYASESSQVDDALGGPIKEFEQKYGGKVDLQQFGDLQPRLISAIAAGNAPDIAFFNMDRMPRYAIQNVVQPLNDLIDINDLAWNRMAMEQMKYNGKYYTVPKDVVAFYIYYNKTIFDNNGLKTPSEYYKEGTWNWENFKKSAIALTQDTDKNGTIDQWGFTMQGDYSMFVASNGADLLEVKDDGSINLTLNDPKTVAALQFVQDGIYKDKYYHPDGKNFRENFWTGKVAMVAERNNTLGDNLKTDMKYEWNIVPFPMGPDVKRLVAPSVTGSWGIPTGAKNPKGAAVWMYIYSKQKINPALKKVFTDAQIDMMLETEKNILIPRFKGLILGGKVNNQLWNQLAKGVPVQTVIDTALPQFQAEIETTLNAK